MISKYKGVIWNKEKEQWQVSICLGTEGVNLGFFDSEEEAARCYNENVEDYLGPVSKNILNEEKSKIK